MLTGLLKLIFGTKSQRDVRRMLPVVAKINRIEVELQALTDEELPEDDFAKLEMLAKLTGTAVPAPLANLKGDEVLHKDCVEKEKMAEFIKSRLN